MDDIDRQVLQRSLVDLQKNLDKETVKKLEDHLYCQQILSDSHIERLDAEVTVADRVRLLTVHILPKCGPHAYQCFIEALAKADCHFVVDLLNAKENESRKHRCAEAASAASATDRTVPSHSQDVLDMAARRKDIGKLTAETMSKDGERRMKWKQEMGNARFEIKQFLILIILISFCYYISMLAFLCAILFAWWFITGNVRRILRCKAVTIWCFDQLQPGDHISIWSSTFAHDDGIIVGEINRKDKVLTLASYSILHGYRLKEKTFAKNFYDTRIYRYDYDFYSSFRRVGVLQRVTDARESGKRFLSNDSFIKWCKCGVPGYPKIWLGLRISLTPTFVKIRHPDELKKGDHIAIARNWIAWRHGILVDITGDGVATIVTLSDEGDITRMECDLRLFRGKTRLFSYIQCLDAEESLCRISEYERRLSADNFFKSDQEFCVWCRTGRAIPAAAANFLYILNGDNDRPITDQDVTSTDGDLDKYLFRQHWVSGVQHECGGETVVSVRNISKYDAETLLKDAGFTGLVVKEAAISVFIRKADGGGNYSSGHRTRTDNIAYVEPPVASGDKVMCSRYNVTSTALFTGAIGSKNTIAYGLTVGHVFNTGPDLRNMFCFILIYTAVYLFVIYFEFGFVVPSVLLTLGCAFALHADDFRHDFYRTFLCSALYIAVVKVIGCDMLLMMPYTAAVGIWTFFVRPFIANRKRIRNLAGRLRCQAILPDSVGMSSADMAFLVLDNDAINHEAGTHEVLEIGNCAVTDEPIEVQIITGCGATDGRIVSLGSEGWLYSKAYEIVTSPEGGPNRTTFTEGYSGGLVVSRRTDEDEPRAYGMVLGKAIRLLDIRPVIRVISSRSCFKMAFALLCKYGYGRQCYLLTESLLSRVVHKWPKQTKAACDFYKVPYNCYSIANSFQNVLNEIDQDTEVSCRIPEIAAGASRNIWTMAIHC